jgi:hypothetical protein
MLGLVYMLGPSLVIIAVVLRLIGSADYAWSAYNKKVSPSPVTWFLWGCTNLVAFIVQVQRDFEPAALATFALCIGPFSIFLITLKNRVRWNITRFDVLCGVSAVAGIVLWQITSDPLSALVFSIIADACAGLPTVVKAYQKPKTEKSLPYLLTIASMLVALLAIKDWTFVHYAFPVYIALINLTIVIAMLVARTKR